MVQTRMVLRTAFARRSRPTRTSCRSLRAQYRSLSSNNAFLHISEEIREAIHSKKPIVALETTIYTHGFPYPDNVALASHLESVVRIHGGVPATIGIIDGVAKIGLSADELIRLTASAGQTNTLKLSRRDLGYVCGMRLAGKKFNGGTTIAGTMVLAHLAGIKVFATGGLGGVHRGAESSMDISADLTELGRTPVTVISSGCKSFLDIPRTLEYLETEGVGVATFADGREGNVDFPAFWSRESGVRSPITIQDEKEAAAIIYAQTTLPLSSGLLFANPIPASASIPKSEMDVIIAEAIKYAEEAGASGKDNTPFILSKIKELSGSKSVKSNRELISANVQRGTLVARELAALESTGAASLEGRANYATTTQVSSQVPLVKESLRQETIERDTQSNENLPTQPSEAEIIVAGALAVDFNCDYAPFPNSVAPVMPQMHTSNPALITPTIGGVAHNIARAVHLLDRSVRLCSVVGDDLSGRAALAQLTANGMDTRGIITLGASTGTRSAQYVAVNNAEKGLVMAMADMTILESSHARFEGIWQNLMKPGISKWLVVDANWRASTLLGWLRAGEAIAATTVYEPVSVAKSTRLFERSSKEIREDADSEAGSQLGVFPHQLVDIATPNSLELAAMHNAAQQSGFTATQEWWRVVDAMGIPSSGARNKFVQATSAQLVDQGVPQQCIQLLPCIPTLLTKLGSQGVLLTMLLKDEDPRLREPESRPYILSRRMNDDDDLGIGGVYMRLFPPAEILGADELVSVNGAGDTFLGALVAGLAKGLGRVEDIVMTAQRAAALTLKSSEAVSPLLRTLRY